MNYNINNNTIWIGCIIIMIILYIILWYKLLKKRASNTIVPVQAKSKHKIIKALLLNGKVNLYGDINMDFTVPNIIMEHIEIVYLLYYGNYVPMVKLMYEEGIGYVLIREDGVGEAKYYPLHKVLPYKPDETFVEGYIKKEDDEDIFVILNKVETDI